MMTKHFTKAIPFKEIYITGLIRDSEGQKMSKSKGNVLDPLDIIDGINLEALISKRISGLLNPDDEQKIIKQTKKDYPQGIKAHGTDALRFTFLSLASGSRDINFDMKRVEGYRNFCNKLWNASRFIELNKPASFKKTNQFIKTPEDKWIVEKLNYTIVSMNTHMDNYRFDLATQSVYEFVWNDFCDWYIEFSKNRLDSDNIKKSEVDRIISGLLNILESILKLCHPFMPFITEEIWNQIASGKKQSFLLNQSFPKKVRISGSKYKEIENLKNSISSIRNMKAEMGIASLKLEEVFISGNKTSLNFILENSDHLKKLAGIKDLKVLEIDKPCAIVVSHDLKFHIPFEGNVDPISEKLRNEQKLQKVTKNLANIENTLSNKKFISSAPKSLVNERKRQYKQALKESKSIQLHLKNLNKLN
jgi:valyl-tRNA synthetase